MRSTWNGALRVGELVVPFGLAPLRTDGTVRLRGLHRGCGSPLAQQMLCALERAPVEPAETVKGFEIAEGVYVELEPDELAALAPARSSLVEVDRFVDASAVDAYVDRSYYALPSKSPIGQRGYVLLAEALATAHAAALGRIVLRDQRLHCAIRPLARTRILLLQTLVPAEDVKEFPVDLDEALAGCDLQETEIELALQLVERRRTRRFQPATILVDEHRQRLRQLIDAKVAGQPLTLTPPADSGGELVPAPTVDLAQALRRSIRPPRKKTTVRS